MAGSALNDFNAQRGDKEPAVTKHSNHLMHS